MLRRIQTLELLYGSQGYLWQLGPRILSFICIQQTSFPGPILMRKTLGSGSSIASLPGPPPSFPLARSHYFNTHRPGRPGNEAKLEVGGVWHSVTCSLKAHVLLCYSDVCQPCILHQIEMINHLFRLCHSWTATAHTNKLATQLLF